MAGNKSTISKTKVRGRKSIAGRVWWVVIEMLLVFGIFFSISIIVITNETRQNSEIKESETLINGMSNTISSNIDTYKDISRLIMLNEDVNTFLRADKVDAGLINDAHYGVMDVLHVCNDIDSVFIFRNDGEYMSTGRTVYNVDLDLMATEEWKKPILDKRGGAIVVMNANGAIYRKNGAPIITIARAIYDIYTQKKSGILLMNISVEMLEKVVADQKNSGVAIYSDDGRLLAGAGDFTEFYNENLFTGGIVHSEDNSFSKERMISGYAFGNLPFRILCSTVPDTEAMMPKAVGVVLLMLLAAFVVSVINTSIFIAKNFTRPLFDLSNSMEKTKQSGWLEKIDVKAPNSEIGVLSDSYNNMIDNLNEMVSSLLEKEKSIQRAEMRVLNEQIKPHFLYNSMETIGYMALDAGAEDVYQALETLGSFYRNFLSKGSREIPLSREVSIIKDYLSLQKLRYGDIIYDRYEISSDTADKLIPKLTLQPLVENCIYHGIRPKGEPCEIIISSYLEEDIIHVSVKDTGIGMSEEAIERVLSCEPGEEADIQNASGSGFGLKGTIERIRYYCNREDVVSITSEPGEYTIIDLKIPIMRPTEGEDI